MVLKTIRIVSTPKPGITSYPRYHGRAYDVPLIQEFWVSQQDAVLLFNGQPTTAEPFDYSEDVEFAAVGTHRIEFGNSASYALDSWWFTQIYVNGVLMIEGETGWDLHLVAFFTVDSDDLPPEEPPEEFDWRIPLGIGIVALFVGISLGRIRR